MENEVTVIRIDSKYLNAAGRTFSPLVMDAVIEKGHSRYLKELCYNTGIINQLDLSTKLADFFTEIYKVLFRSFRNEYVYKNEIARKILLGRHSLNTANMLTEFRTGKCKADAVIINKTSTAYEIKTELDSFNRLSKQIHSYLKAFDKVYVITSQSKIRYLNNFLPDNIGILSLTDRNTISTVKKAKSNLQNIDLALLFDSLRKSEYTRIICEYYGAIPDVPNTLIFSKCKELFVKIPVEDAHKLVVKVLKKRNKTNELGSTIDKIPKELIGYLLTIANDTKKIRLLSNRLHNCIGDIIDNQKEEVLCTTHI